MAPENDPTRLTADELEQLEILIHDKTDNSCRRRRKLTTLTNTVLNSGSVSRLHRASNHIHTLYIYFQIFMAPLLWFTLLPPQRPRIKL
jgi:membrane protein required for beta-lactamase induction